MRAGMSELADGISAGRRQIGRALNRVCRASRTGHPVPAPEKFRKVTRVLLLVAMEERMRVGSEIGLHGIGHRATIPRVDC